MVTQHINPSSHIDDDDNQLIKDSTQLGYRNPPKAKLQGAIPSSSQHVPLTKHPTPEGFQVPPTADYKFGKTNLHYLKSRFQHKKESTETMVQTGAVDFHP